MIKQLFPILFLIFGVIVSCKRDVGIAKVGDYPAEVGKIMVHKCATSGCHNDASYEAAAGLNLSTWNDLFKGSKSGSSVIPYSSKFSSLCYFVNTYPDLGAINAPQMPLNTSPLTREEVMTINSWINDGAKSEKGNEKWEGNPNRKKLYVTNMGCDVVTVIDAETQLPIKYVDVGNKPGVIEVPHTVRVSGDGQFWYVSFIGNNIIQKYRCSDDTFVGEVVIGPNYNWHTMTLSDDGKRAYASSFESNGRIAFVDVEHMRLIRNPVGFAFPHGIALNEANDVLYITAQIGNFIFKVDTAFTFVNQITIDPGFAPSSTSKIDAQDIILSADKKKLFITCEKTNDVREFDIATEQITNIFNTGYQAQLVVQSAAKNKLYVTAMYDTTAVNKGDGLISVIDLATSSIQHIKVGFMPHGICLDEAKDLLYIISKNAFSNGPAPHHIAVCNGRNGYMNFIRLSTLEVLKKKTELSVGPWWISLRK